MLSSEDRLTRPNDDVEKTSCTPTQLAFCFSHSNVHTSNFVCVIHMKIALTSTKQTYTLQYTSIC